jgi:hypothetical protein
MLLANKTPFSVATWLIAVGALVFAFIAFSAGTSPCAQAAASCAFDDDAIVVGDLTLESNTAFSIGIGHTATADATLTIPNTAGVADTFVMVAQTQTITGKTFTSPTITGAPTAAGATWSNLGSVSNIDINGGGIDATTIGAITPSTGNFSVMGASSGDIDSGTIDGTTIGAAIPAVGTFTTLSATTLGSALNINNENLTLIDIDSGAIDNTTIGAAVPAAGTFTTLDTTAATTLGGNLDYGNNNANNIGNSATDITSTGATFALGVPGTFSDTASSTDIGSTAWDAGAGAALNVAGEISSASSVVAGTTLHFGATNNSQLGETQGFIFTASTGEMADNVAEHLFEVDAGAEASMSAVINLTCTAYQGSTANRDASRTWQGIVSFFVVSTSVSIASTVDEYHDGGSQAHDPGQWEIDNIVVSGSAGNISILVDGSGLAAEDETWATCSGRFVSNKSTDTWGIKLNNG